MLKLHITKVKNKILIPEEEFKEIVKQLEVNNNVIIESNEFNDLLEASSSGLDFWDNQMDDNIWNNA